MMRRSLLAAVTALGLTAAVIGPAGAIPGPGVISNKNMEWTFNMPQAVGSDIEFLEMKQADGSLKRYAITGSMGNGFNIYDITLVNETVGGTAVLTGTFVDPGVNWQGDVQVNPKRKLVVLATESPGATVSHGVGSGLVFVDVSNPSLPTQVGQITLSGPAHNSTIINDQYVYTTSPVRIIDYTNPAAPVDKGPIGGMCNGHDITVDPNRPNIIYNACASNQTQIWDVSNPLTPTRLATIQDTRIQIAHQADPNLDSSLLFITDERGGGTGNTTMPGGGVHVYDISGKYKPGASINNPIKVGAWFAPFYGLTGNDTAGGPWGNNTAHNMTFQAERNLLSIGWYTGGSFVADMEGPTLASGGVYTNEYKGTNHGGPTTWGNTMGNILLEGDEVWSTKWTRFDDPAYDRLLYTNGLTRADVLRYNGPMPKKHARLNVSDTAAGGVVSGKLDRYAVWTFNGWENRPLAGKTVTITVGDKTTQATTGADGSFSATLALAAGTHNVTVTWDGDSAYRQASLTQTVTV